MLRRMRKAVCDCGAETVYVKRDLNYVHLKVEGKSECKVHYIVCKKCLRKVVIETLDK